MQTTVKIYIVIYINLVIEGLNSTLTANPE